MTAEQKEGNVMIARFMGLEVAYGYHGDNAVYLIPPMTGITAMDYHTSWDWLMPVVEKIERHLGLYFEVVIYSASCRIVSKETAFSCHIVSKSDSIPVPGMKIDAVFTAVVEFIKWHNNQPHDQKAEK